MIREKRNFAHVSVNRKRATPRAVERQKSSRARGISLLSRRPP